MSAAAAPVPAPALRADGLSVRYARSSEPVLRDVSARVEDGQGLLVLGPSGSGKSTLLHAACGVVPGVVDAELSGTLEIAGRHVGGRGVPELSREVGLLQQHPTDQLCLDTVFDEVAFALENRGVPRAHIDARVHDALRRAGVAALTGRRTGELSGGEAQRVALAATLVARPRLLLLDEPTASLDPRGVQEVAGLLTRLAGEDGPAVVMVEHRLDELGALPSHTLLLGADGAARACGPTPEVLHDLAGVLHELGCWLPFGTRVRAAGLEGTWLRTLEERLERDRDRARPGGPPGPVLLAARDLEVLRGGRSVLRLDALDLHAGEVVVVLGANGAGKTSLLHALTGVVDRRGSVRGGPVGLVFQHPEHQFLARSVREEIAYGPRRAGLPDVDGRVAEALGSFGLHGVADSDPFRLSGGQQRRLSLAAMAVSEAPVLLVDEPTFGQDRAGAEAVARRLRALADEGRALLVVTHDLRLAARIADRAVVLDQGRVVAQGPAEEALRAAAALPGSALRVPAPIDRLLARGLPLRAASVLVEEILAEALSGRVAA